MAADHTVTAPSTHTQPSRKGKKAWRKNVDLTQVQQGLEDLRTEQIQSGGVVAEKDASELFATDTAGDEVLGKQHQPGRKLLKAEEILARRSAIPGLEKRKRKNIEDVTVSGKRVKNGTFVTHKRLQRLRDVADKKRMNIDADAGATHDPWAEAETTTDERFSFLEDTRPKTKREPRTLKHPPTSLATNGKPLRNVRIPDAGKSYNPLVGDWSALFAREGAAAVEIEKFRLQAEFEATEKEARAEAEAAKVEAAETEAYATDYDSAWESEWDGFQSGAENEEVFTQKQKSRKTAVERNKVIARKEREALENHERKMKEREKQERQISAIAKEVSAKDKARRAHSQSLQLPSPSSDSSDSGEEEVQLRRRRFGKLPVPDAPLEVVLPDELEDSLRRLRPEGNLMQDRYRNLLVSGKVEVRRRRGERKLVKVTRGEKWSYKDWKLK